MSNIEIVTDVLRAIENGDRSRIESLLAPDYQFRHAALDAPLDRNEFITMVTNLQKAMPDLKYNETNLNDGPPVTGTIQITGTHTAPLNLPPLIDAPVPATNKKVKLPRSELTWTIKGDRVVRAEAKGGADTGPLGILRQLDVPVTKTH